MTHRVLKRPFEVVPEEVEPEQPEPKRPRELTDEDIDPLNYLDYLQQQLYDSMELRQLSGLFVERLFGGVSRVCLYKKPRSNRRTKYNRADFASLGLVVLHQKFTRKLRDQIYDQGYGKVKLNQEFNGKVVLQPATLLDMGFYSPSVLLHPPLIAPDPASQPEFGLVIDGDVIDAAVSRNGHELSAYFASILGDSETPTVLKGTAINAHAATMSLLLAYHEAKRQAGPAPRFCKPRSFGAWMETVFVDVLPADVIENIRRYLCVLPIYQVTPGVRTWTLDCALATGVYFSRSDSMTYERVVESPLPLDPSSWWWHRVLAEPKPLPFAHVSRLGGAAPPHFRLALLLFRHPAQFGFDRNDAVPLRSLSNVYCCMALGAKLLRKFEPGRTSSLKFRAEYNQQLAYITWVLASYYSVTAVMWSFYSAMGGASRGDMTFDKMQTALYDETRITVFTPREEVLHTILNDIDHGLWPQTYYVRPNGLADPAMPPLWPYFSENSVSAAAVLLNQSARIALFKAVRKLRMITDTSTVYFPSVEYGRGRIVLDGDLTFKKFLVELTVAPSWKPTPCGLCRNCQSHIEGLSTSVCLAPTYLPTGPLRKHPESLGSLEGRRATQFAKRWDDAVIAPDQKVMALLHHGTRFVKDSHDYWKDSQIHASYEKRRPGVIFQDVYRLRSFSGQNSAPHNHFIDGGKYRASLLEDESHWLKRAELLGFHLPISNFCRERDFAVSSFVSSSNQEMTPDSSKELGLSTTSARRSFALRTIGVSHPNDPRDLLINRTVLFNHVLIELMAATEPIRDSLSGKSIYAHAHSTALDGLRVPGEYPFDCLSDSRRSAYAKELHEFHISQIKFVSACRPYPGAAPFGSLAADFGLPVRRAKSPCEHVYQLRIRVHGSTKRGADFYDSNINFAISTQSHTTIKRVVMTRDAGQRSVVPRLRKSSANPPRKFDRYDSRGASLEEAMSGGLRLFSFGSLHVRNRKWLTETDLSPEATRAVFEPDQLRHQWEALSWMADLRGYTLYTGIDPDTGYYQLIDSFHARRGTLNGNALTDVMEMETQDDGVWCPVGCGCEDCDD